MLKQIQVFDREVFTVGTPVKVAIPGRYNNNFYGMVTACDLEKLSIAVVLHPDNKVNQYNRDKIDWWHEDESVRFAAIDIKHVLNKEVEVFLLDKEFNKDLLSQ